MRSLLRIFTFTYIAFYLTEKTLNSFSLEGNPARTTLLVVLALVMLNLFVASILGIVSLPTQGIGFLFMNFILTGLVLFLLSVVIPGFGFTESVTPRLLILGIVIPSRNLAALQSGIISALLISIIYTYFNWISVGRRK